MKGGGSSAALGYPAKRRWRCLAMGVLFLVVLSMLVPLVFLLGLYNGFHPTGYISDQRPSSASDDIVAEHGHNISDVEHHSERDTSSHVDKVIKRLVTILPKDIVKNHPNKEKNGTIQMGSSGGGPGKAGLQRPPTSQKLSPSKPNKSVGDGVEVRRNRSTVVDQRVRLCELSFGSYCLWLEENREDMKDVMVKKLKDRLFVARAYFPSIAKLPAQSKLSHELKQNIQDLEKIFSESSTDPDLPPFIEKKLQRMEAAISKAQLVPAVECSNVDKKLRQILDLTEDEANFHMKQSAFLYQLAVQTMPKSHHCLLMRLTVEYFKSSLYATQVAHPEKYSDPTLHHYIILSKNVLASSVVINSTVSHARETGNLAFHVLTDAQNYFAMKHWFLRNMYKKAVVEVINIEDLSLDDDKSALSSLSLPVEFRVTLHSNDNPPENHLKTEYLSVFSHSHYLLPYIFPKLKRIVVLDDDVVVQRDLTELWSLKMGGKVVGALQLCSVRLAELSNLFGDSSFDRNSCTWLSGLNVVDLVRWRELGLTNVYQKFSQEAKGTGSAEAVALRGSLLAFQDMVYPLDDSWVLSGLGHEHGFDLQKTKNAAVLHYNGNLKPWLELGIPKYKRHWQRFLNREDQFLAECNVNS